MKPIVDTHTHIYYKDESPRFDFSQDIDEVIKRAKAAGVAYALLPNIDSESYPLMMDLVDRHPDFCRPMIGLHPTDVGANWSEELAFVEGRLSEGAERFIAIGEIGLDYHWSLEYKMEMTKAFEGQLELAHRYKLPVSVHSRDAEDDTIEMLSFYDKKGVKGVVHSFGGNEEQLQNIMEQLPHFMVGINGTITYKNSELPRFLASFPLERIVIETDAPFLAPIPFRGKRNEPSYLKVIVAKLQEIYDESEEVVRAQLFANSKKMFNLSPIIEPNGID